MGDGCSRLRILALVAITLRRPTCAAICAFSTHAAPPLRRPGHHRVAASRGGRGSTVTVEVEVDLSLIEPSVNPRGGHRLGGVGAPRVGRAVVALGCSTRAVLGWCQGLWH